MKRFLGIYIASGHVRRMTFEAADAEDAQKQASQWPGVGVAGEAEESAPVRTALPEAFNAQDSRRLLGNIGLSTLYDMVYDGRLERVPGIRKLLITRRSIERWAAQR